MPHLSAVSVAVLVLLVTSGAQAQSASWRYQTERDVDYLRLTPRGTLLVGTGNETLVLDGGSGKPLWSRRDLTGCKALDPSPVQEYEFKCESRGSGDLNFVMVPTESPRIVGHHAPDGRFAVLDLDTGKTLFDSAGQEIGKVRRYALVAPFTQVVFVAEGPKSEYSVHAVGLDDGSLRWSFESAITDDPVWLGSPSPGSLLLYGKGRNGTRVLAEFDVEAGKNAWQSSTILKEDVREAGPRMVGAQEWRSKAYRVAPLIHDAGTTLAFISRDGPMRFDRNGQVLWRASDLGGADPSQMILENGGLFTRQGRDLVAVDAATGRTRWRQRLRLEPAAIVPLADTGLLVWTHDRVDLLSFETGARLWPDVAEIPSVRDSSTWNIFSPDWNLGGVSPLLVGDGKLFVAGRRTLAAIDVATGVRTDLAGYDFRGDEAPEVLERWNEGFLLMSHQNIVGLDRDGRERFARYYPAPGLSSWAKLGIGLVSVAAGQSAPLAMAFRMRIREMAISDRAVYMHFENREGRSDAERFGLVRLDAGTGEARGTLWHNERNPILVMNPASGVVYVRRGGTTVEGVRFE
ncbi:MAG TPA: PQQ-binding-like beta-propeller repeat protein [Vicinamibacterales bacterium]|nr:PQQ-binding-like beta-propeller repeat protein [Vicinamibacterales bacterium]